MRLFSQEVTTHHRRLEERSLALHREIARRIRRDPDLLRAVRDRLTKDIESRQFSLSVTDAMQEWLDLLNTRSLKEKLELLVDQGENARRLQQSTPFTAQGAGRIGLWEDIASLAGVADLQKQIALSVTSSAAAVSAWKADPSLDAWITFRTWQYRLPEATEIVEIDRKYRPSRATPIAIAKTSSDPALAQKFIDYLKSDAGKAIFQKWGYN